MAMGRSTKRRVSNSTTESVPAKKSKMIEIEAEVQFKEEETFDDDFVEQISADAQSIAGEPRFMYTQEDLQQLSMRVRMQCQAVPRSEQLAYTMTFDKLDFEKIKFGDYSAEDCKNITKSVFKFIRKTRNMSEMMGDFDEFITDGEKFNRYQKDLAGPLKKPPTPCIMFINENRQAYREKYPDETQSNLYKIMSEAFKKLPAKKKQKFIKDHEQKLEEYKKQMEEHFQSHPEAYVSVSRRAKHRNNNLPERPQRPREFYLAKQLRQYDPVDQENKDLIESIKEQFDGLSDKKKLKYIRKTLRDEERYCTEMENAIALNPELEVPKQWRKTCLSKSEQSLLYKSEGRPEKPPHSGYVLYSSIVLPELSDIQARERMIIIAKRWNELSDKDKDVYNEQTARLNEQYIIDFDAYLQTLDPEKADELRKAEKSKALNRKAAPNEIVKAGKLVYKAEKMKLPEYKGKAKKELDDLINQEWNKLSNDERSDYLEKGRNYEMINSLANESTDNNKRITKTKEIGKFSKRFGVSFQVNSFSLFMMENIDAAPGEKATDRMREVSEQWRNMDLDEKDFYRKRNDAERKVMEEMYEEYNREVDLGTAEDSQWTSEEVKGKEFRRRVADMLRDLKLDNGKPFPLRQLIKCNPQYKDSLTTPMKISLSGKNSKKTTTSAFNSNPNDSSSDYNS